MYLQNLAEETHSIAVEKGFYDGEINVAEKVMLICTEIKEYSDVWMTYTKSREELADILIRVLDLCGCLQVFPQKDYIFDADVELILSEGRVSIFKENLYDICADLVQAHRKSRREDVENHLISLVEEIADFTSLYVEGFEEALEKKIDKNRGREYRHGAKY